MPSAVAQSAAALPATLHAVPAQLLAVVVLEPPLLELLGRFWLVQVHSCWLALAHNSGLAEACSSGLVEAHSSGSEETRGSGSAEAHNSEWAEVCNFG